MLKKLDKFEIKSILLILTFLFLVTTINIRTSLRRGRDSTRKNDLSAMQKAIDLYKQKYKFYPLSTDDGRIIGCFDTEPKFDKKSGAVINSLPCEWGVSKFENIMTMVRDPSSSEGSSYKYVSDGNYYKIYVSLEGKDEAEYSLETFSKNLQCGTKVCNYERGSI